MTVTIELADLCEIFGTAKLYDHVQRKAEAAEKKNAEFVKECETQALEISQLRCRIMEAEKELAAWNTAQNADKPEEAAYTYLHEHNSPFEDNSVDKACVVIRALLAAKPEAEKPRELQPVTKTAISNARDVLDRLFRPIVSEEDAAKESVPGDHFQSVYKTLRELVSRLEQEGLK